MMLFLFLHYLPSFSTIVTLLIILIFFFYLDAFIFCFMFVLLFGSFGSDLSSNIGVVGSGSPSDFPEYETFLEISSTADYEWGGGDVA